MLRAQETSDSWNWNSFPQTLITTTVSPDQTISTKNIAQGTEFAGEQRCRQLSVKDSFSAKMAAAHSRGCNSQGHASHACWEVRCADHQANKAEASSKPQASRRRSYIAPMVRLLSVYPDSFVSEDTGVRRP